MKKYLYLILIFLITVLFLSCYIGAEDNNRTVDSVHLSIFLPESVSKAAAAPDYYILYIWVINTDLMEEFNSSGDLAVLEDSFYFTSISYPYADDIYGTPVNLVINDLRVDDNYFVMANYVDDLEMTDILFISPEPFSVVENTVTTVTLVDFESLFTLE